MPPADSERCQAGEIDACNLQVSRSMHAYHQSKSNSETARRHLQLAEASATEACKLGSDIGCSSTIEILIERNAPTNELELAREKSLEVAEAGCNKGDERRCERAIKYAQPLGNSDRVRRLLSRRCELKFKGNEPIQIVDRLRCTTAASVGLTEQQMRERYEKLSNAGPALRDGVYNLSSRKLEANLISGSFKIEVPPAEAELHEVASSAWRFCVSETGTVTNAVLTHALPEAMPLWEKKIVETMATWRFQPVLVDGDAKPVCTVITFSAFRPF